MRGNGYTGQLLKVDLSKGQAGAEPAAAGILRPFIGGRGLGIELLTELAPARVEPLSPKNPLILATGPYTGRGVFSAFFNVTCKAPLTGLAASSHCGGKWGPKLKGAGFDALVVTGAAEKPCYLVIDEGEATLKDAAELWGKGVFETENIIREKEGEVEIVSIGPAGENRVHFAAMMNGHRAAGRGGVGAVMGSKLLKAVAVKGNAPARLHDPERVNEISRQGGKRALENGAAFAKYGSSMAFSLFNEKKMLPTRNFREGHFADADKIDAEALKQNYFVKNRGCANCPLRCGNVHRIPEGTYQLDEVEGPEYETLMAFGSNCGNSNLESILKANYLCNDLGIDTITCGDIFALLMDLFDLGILGTDELDGHTLSWGEHESVVALIPKIASREGVGDLLAQGSYRAAEKWGAKALERVIHSKRQEFPGYESRRSFGTGFSLVTSNRGADHLRAALYVNEIFLGEFDQDGFESHIDTLLDKEHQMAMADSFCVCKFGQRNAEYTWPVMTELYNALTGFGFSESDLKRAGERIWNLERLYNLREGVGEDLPPPRFFAEDLADGFEGGSRITMDRFVKARALYYQARGWDENGVPQPDKLEDLGLESL
jgi:aldehyde:ferredoxin oxidoreductase